MSEPAKTHRVRRASDGRRTSRFIDQLTDALGDEKAFAIAAVLVCAATVLGLMTRRLGDVASVATLVTFVMVFAVQHTSSREARALNVKVDELIRATNARNDLIGVEDESHRQLDERSRHLLEERAGRSDLAGPSVKGVER